MSRLYLVLRVMFGQRVIRVPFHLLGYVIELVDVGPGVLLIQVRRTQFPFLSLFGSLSAAVNRVLIVGRHR